VSGDEKDLKVLLQALLHARSATKIDLQFSTSDDPSTISKAINDSLQKMQMEVLIETTRKYVELKNITSKHVE